MIQYLTKSKCGYAGDIKHMNSRGDQPIVSEWHELGFYYDFDERLSVNQWRFYGSVNGLQKFVRLLITYTSDEELNRVSEHEHYFPYGLLKLMTWSNPVIASDHIAGSFDDLKRLCGIITNKLKEAQPGQTFFIDKEYGPENTATMRFFVMHQNFDPASLDELIVSSRQHEVNKALGRGSES